MATVHQEQAAKILAKMASAKITDFPAALDEFVPGWKVSADRIAGYSDHDHHVRNAVAVAVYSALPPPFSVMKYDALDQHGFSPAIVYLSHPLTAASDIKKVLRDAVARNASAMSD